MTELARDIQQQLRELKRGFDLSFCEAPAARNTESDDVLAIELAGRPYALRAGELLGLYVERAVTALPSAPTDLLGLAALRGELVAVYDLASLLGYTRGGAPRYLALARGPQVAFGFSVLRGHMRVAKAEIAPSERAREPWLREVVRENDRARPIVELTSLSTHIEQRLRLEGGKEHEHG